MSHSVSISFRATWQMTIRILFSRLIQWKKWYMILETIQTKQKDFFRQFYWHEIVFLKVENYWILEIRKWCYEHGQNLNTNNNVLRHHMEYSPYTSPQSGYLSDHTERSSLYPDIVNVYRENDSDDGIVWISFIFQERSWGL